MSEDYGKRIGKAFEAIYQLHKDASRLLSDCDGTIGKGKPSIFGGTVMKDLSKVVNRPDEWMPYAVYRYYDASEQGSSGHVDGMMIYFWDSPPQPDEPMIILGRLKYHLEGGESVESVCEGWDLWWAAFQRSKERAIGKVIGLECREEGHHVEWVKFLLTPLYSIRSIQEVERLMGLVNQTAM